MKCLVSFVRCFQVMGGDKAQHVVETVVFNFIPDYSPGQKLRMSEFLGFFGTFVLCSCAIPV